MELGFTLDTNLPKQQKSLLKRFLKGLILILTRGIETGELMESFVYLTVTVAGWIATLNVKKSDHLAGPLS